MSALGKAWNRFFYEETNGQRTAWTRILFGAYMLGYFGVYARRVPLAFSNEGIQVPYLVPNYAPDPAIAYLLYGATLVLCAALLVGYRTRLTAPLLLLSFAYHYFLYIAVKQSSFERVIAIMMVVMCVADSGRVLGLDARRPGPTPTAWPERAIQLQTLFLYFGSGFWKLLTPAWHGGELLRSNMQGMFATPLAYAIVRMDLSEQFWTLLSRSVIGFELLLPVLFVVRRTRPLAILLGMGFHLFNCVVLAIPEFLICATAYPMFVERATLERASARITGWLTRKPATRQPSSA